MRSALDPTRPAFVALVFTALAVATTWPLAAHLGTRLAADLGDPPFNCWVLAWTSGQVIDAITGNVSALARYWQGNIFHPEPLTLAYSEHLTGEMLQALPIVAATGNIIAAYNTLFIATFALSGWAMYLLARELTGRPLAAFLAGVAFAYAPYRLGQFSHLQVLSSYWMPLALFGVRRYFAAGSRRALAGGVAALVMQNLSCGYYMLFFTPLAAAYCAYEAAARRRLSDLRLWRDLALAACAVAILTWPFVAPYLELRSRSGLGVRSRSEIQMFSADAHAFVSIAQNARLLADSRAGLIAPEGEGFVGFTIFAFAAAGAAVLLWRTARAMPWDKLRDWHALGLIVAALVTAGSIAAVIAMFVSGQLHISLGNQQVIYRNAARPLTYAAFGLVAFLALRWPAQRDRQPQHSDGAGFFLVAALVSALFAMGPTLHALGRGLGPGPYSLLLDYVPGFDGLRVPARLVMLVALCLAALAGVGASAVLQVRPRLIGRGIVLAGAALMVAESWVAPMGLNTPVMQEAGLYAPPPPASGRRVPQVYTYLRDLPGAVVLVELPFGDQAYDVLATFYAGYHRRALVNGYSGFFPEGYADRVHALRDIPSTPERALAALRDTGATHVLLHRAAFPPARADEIAAWLISIGARPIGEMGTDAVYAMR